MPISGPAIESLFDFEMMSRGFTVSAPRADTAPYDRIVDTRVRLYRVQVKARRCYGKTNVSVKISKHGDKPYTKDDTDIIALYIEDSNSWYLFPVNECKRNIRININGGTQERYKNLWSIFK